MEKRCFILSLASMLYSIRAYKVDIVLLYRSSDESLERVMLIFIEFQLYELSQGIKVDITLNECFFDDSVCRFMTDFLEFETILLSGYVVQSFRALFFFDDIDHLNYRPIVYLRMLVSSFCFLIKSYACNHLHNSSSEHILCIEGTIRDTLSVIRGVT